MNTIHESDTTGGTMKSYSDAVLCRVTPLLLSEHGFVAGEYFTHNAGVAGSSPAPATIKERTGPQAEAGAHAGTNRRAHLWIVAVMHGIGKSYIVDSLGSVR